MPSGLRPLYPSDAHRMRILTDDKGYYYIAVDTEQNGTVIVYKHNVQIIVEQQLNKLRAIDERQCAHKRYRDGSFVMAGDILCDIAIRGK